MNSRHKPSFVITPLKALWRWLMSEPGQKDRSTVPDLAVVMAPVTVDNSIQYSSTLSVQRNPDGAAPRRPVRVLQVLDVGQSPHHVGRLRISGRMADVCAELDRLVARELLLH
jgi:hypothetical protein